MTIELTYLTWAIVLGIVHGVATGQLTVLQKGMAYGLSPRDEKQPLTGVPARIERAFTNYLQSFSFFAAAVLLAHALGRHNGLTVWGAALFFWARLAFVPLYAVGIHGPRTLAYVVSMVGIALLLIGLT